MFFNRSDDPVRDAERYYMDAEERQHRCMRCTADDDMIFCDECEEEDYGNTVRTDR